jgi:alkanesulfonate monooxygenase SsuD/methylene tetrahydromethanopterin reductase-like flavin-dependent oxidoreductase (luciferase family)
MTLKFGAHYSGSLTKGEVAAYARGVESLGFDGLWITEGARSREPLTVLAAAAAVTELDLGTAVLLAPLRDPPSSRDRSQPLTPSAVAKSFSG